jgi:hypothetical protein
MTVTRITDRSAFTATCEARVTLTKPGTQTRQFREEKARRRGHPVAECGDSAEYRADGVDLCERHAGAAALRFLLSGSA